MFFKDLQLDFYNIIARKRILIIVNSDIDGICASKILQSLLKYDNILYSLVPVLGMASLKRAYRDNSNGVKHVILMNCGGCVDIIELLQPEEDVVFFIFDAHRPLDVCNIYSDQQVFIYRDAENIEDNLPSFDSLFAEMDDQETIVADVAKRKWEAERDRIMSNYLQYSYYGRSSAIIMFELAWKLSKDCIDSLWWAIVGATEQVLVNKVERSVYILEESVMQGHLSRIISDRCGQSKQNDVKITLKKELSLILYRHWSIHDSLRYSIYTANELKLWTQRGEKRLHELLVEAGLPLKQSKQIFGSMDLVLRQDFQKMVEKLAAKYEIPEAMQSAFTLQYGYGNVFSASDYVYAIMALLSSNEDRTPEDLFLEALDCLSRCNKAVLTSNIEKAKLLVVSIFKHVQNILELNQVHVAGSYMYYVCNEENVNFTHPYGISLLARYLLSGYSAVSRRSSAYELPLIVSCLIDAQSGTYLMMGIPPMRDGSAKNLFGRAFEEAAKRSSSGILQDSFEREIIQIRQSEITKFLDALHIILG